MTEEKENNVRTLKNELDERSEILDDVLDKMKKETESGSDKELETIKRIEKNIDVMKRVSELLEKNTKSQEE